MAKWPKRDARVPVGVGVPLCREHDALVNYNLD